MNIFESNLQSMRYFSMQAKDKLAVWKTGVPEGYSTGFRSLDAYLRLEAETYTIIAARPSMGKCLGKGTKVFMYDGTFKNVEDIEIGDQLMGPDSTPRNVLSLARGQEMMYWIHQKHGVSYRVNQSHILSLKRSKEECSWRHGDVLNISVNEVKDKGPGFFCRFKGYKVSVDFPCRDVPIDPYFLGLWLGDGKSEGSSIYTTDEEVITYLYEYADSRQEHVNVREMHRPCSSYSITGGRSQLARNGSLAAALNRMGLQNNKHIPQGYLINSKQNRLRLLAGLIDSDGHYLKSQNGPYEITLINKRLAEQVKFLCDSLGYRTSFTERIARNQNGYTATVYRVRFNGNVDEIPVKVCRKKAAPWTDFRDWQMTGIMIEQDKVDDYYGFVIDGDHLFLLEDMTVTHNTTIAMQIVRNVAQQIRTTGDDGVCAVFSAEMTGRQLVIRMASEMKGINSHKLRMGKGTPEEFALVEDAIDEIARLPIYIDEGAAPSTKIMLQRLQELHEITPVRCMMFDFVELGGDDGDTEELRIGSIHKSLKAIAKTLKIPVIGLCQVSRDVEKTTNKLPQMNNLRYSGQAEQVADKVATIMRPEYYIERGMTVDDLEPGDESGVAIVNVVKFRDGPVGMVRMNYEKEYGRFSDRIQKVHL